MKEKDWCKCTAPMTEQYLDVRKRLVRKYRGGAVSLSPTCSQSLAVRECPRFTKALTDLKDWVDTRR